MAKRKLSYLVERKPYQSSSNVFQTHMGKSYKLKVPFVTVHTFCVSWEGPRNSGFLWVASTKYTGIFLCGLQLCEKYIIARI